MAEETQTFKCNGDTKSEISHTTNIIDQMDTSLVCETQGSDPMVASDSKGVYDIHSADDVDSSHLENKEKTGEAFGEHPREHETIHQQDSESLTSHNTDSEEHGNEGDLQARLETKGDNVLSDDSPGQEELPEEEKDHGENKTELQDILPYEESKHLTDSREEETETEEENTSIETDNDNGQESCGEHESGSGPFQSNPEQPVPGNRPDISRHSYSRYDTVSYRKIRKGNTKQRIDEFESMMN